MSRFTVVFDACVLYPAPLRDFLMELAATELFRAKWTDAIHEEWTRNVLKNRPDLTPEQLRWTRQRMEASVADCLVSGYEHLIPVLNLPDPDDRHVLAAAIHARADAIITFNLRDFPIEDLAKFNVEPIHPDDFIHYQFDLKAAAVVIAAGNCCRRLKKPPKSGSEYLDTLEKQGLPRTVTALRPFAAVLSQLPTSS
ncbi:PIN domain-containing protein [Nitrospirillum sp. BR 11752]|uniref:PIN domain-containing protein n=1 Tax=Nitrospirillum sp. BR 11752 TaxID=3104293 RepID=UPI002EBC87F5|nr:PIN domain-containing protein [Nitrospirillum sp. BR 11752]